MRKSATLLALFLGLSFFLAIQAQNPNCSIRYQNYYDPEEFCDYSYDPDFGSNVNCASNGPGEPTGISRFASLDSEEPTFSAPAFAVQNIWLFGNCDCTIKAFTNANLGGCSVTSQSDSDNVGRVGGQTLWNRAGTAQSFSITCQF